MLPVYKANSTVLAVIDYLTSPMFLSGSIVFSFTLIDGVQGGRRKIYVHSKYN